MFSKHKKKANFLNESPIIACPFKKKIWQEIEDKELKIYKI